MADSDIIPEHHSPVRHLVSQSRGLPYHPIDGFETAKKNNDAVVILEGDWGGQIYLVCPIPLVKCSDQSLKNLLDELDKVAWECNDGEGASIFYERRLVGEGVAGGMGGGRVTTDIWIHEEFIQRGLESRIRAVIASPSSCK